MEKEVPCDKAVTVEEVVELWSRSKISPEVQPCPDHLPQELSTQRTCAQLT